MLVLELILILLAAAAALQYLADKIGVPHPALLVLGGLALALTPGLPRVDLDPEAIFVVFVPPLLYRASLLTSLRDFRVHLPAILTLAVVFCLGTVAVVAAVAHWLSPEFTWAAAFVLGAIVSPPDAVSAVAVMRRLGVPSSLVTILEGEGLVNDATALVAYRMAMMAVVTGSFSISKAGVQLVIATAGGIAVGIAVAAVVVLIRKIIGRSPLVENTISILTPFASYIAAEKIGGSGVLAVVATGLYLSRTVSRFISPQTRLQSQVLWDMIVFMLEGLIFILIGLYLPASVGALKHHSLGQLLGYAAVISAVVVGVRLMGVFPVRYLPTIVARRFGATWTYAPWQNVTFIGWAGMRGGDSLVIALALPLTTVDGAPFPARDLIIFITFAVILFTLVVQGFSFGASVRLLGLHGDGQQREEEERARRASIEASLARLDELAKLADAPQDLINDLRCRHERRLHYLTEKHPLVPAPEMRDEMTAFRYLRAEMLQAGHAALIRLRDEGAISDGAMMSVQQDLDLEVTLLEHGPDRIAT